MDILDMDHKIESSELDTGAAVPSAVPSAVAQILFKQENNDERNIVNQPLIYQVENRKEQTCLPLLDTGISTDRGVNEEIMHSDVKLTVVNYDGWITSFVQQLSKLWEDQKLCDLRITTHDGAAILVHSCVVAVWSKAICSFLTQDSTPHTIKDITISSLDQSTLMLVLQFIYAGTVSISASHLGGLLDAAELLEIEHLIHVCKDLQKHLADLEKAGPIESNVVFTLPQDQGHSHVKVEETVGKRKRGRPRKFQQNNNTTDKKTLPSLHKCHNKPDLSSEKLIFRQISKFCGGSQDHIPEFLPAEPVKVSTGRKRGRPRKNPTARVETPLLGETEVNVSLSDNQQEDPSAEDPTEAHQDITELPMKASENCVELLHDENHQQLVDQSSDIVEATKALSDQPREHACVICNRVFSNRKKLSNHMSRHLHVTPQSLVCPTCGKQMPSRQHLLKHERSHLPSQFVKCGKCSKTFRNESSLRKHCTYAHPSDAMQIPLLPCCHCGKAFTRANVLRRHEVACSGKRPYKCKKCDQSFGHHNVLRHHMLTHESTCKYECSFCFRAFNRSDNLKVHMRKHTGEKPYLCTLCGQQFRHNVTLKGHINSIHQDKSLSDLGLTPVEKGKPREGGYTRRKYVSDISQSGNSRSHAAPLIQEEQEDTVSDQSQYVDGHFPVVMVRFKENPPGSRAVYEDVFPEPLEDNTILPQYVQPVVHNETLSAVDPQHHQGNGQL